MYKRQALKDNAFPTESPEDHIWTFDPANEEWIQGPEIPQDRKRGSAGLVVYQDKFYVVAGNTNGHGGGYVPWFDEYDPKTGVWTSLADAPNARDHFHAAVIGDKLYAAGGRLSGGTGGTFAPTIAAVDVFDFTTGTWSSLPETQNIPTPRGGAATVNFNDRLVVVGGEVLNQEVYGELLDDALVITEEYDPATQTWERLDDLNYERHGIQGIVSGEAIYVVAGSPNRGGGRQKNMEFMGVDAPVGSPSIASLISAPEEVEIEASLSVDIPVTVSEGNVGIIVVSTELSGDDAAAFSILSGQLTHGLLHPDSTHNITIGVEEGEAKTAVLTLHYNNGSTLDITINYIPNEPPVALATATPLIGDVPLEVTFTGSASTDDKEIVSYLWDFGTGDTSSEIDPIYTFTEVGIYEVSLTVTDQEGLEDTTTLTITVEDALIIDSFTLINSETDADILELVDGAVIDFASIQGLGVNIRANSDSDNIGSVVLQLSGPISTNRTEGVSPYALFGDNGGDYFDGSLPEGVYTLTATPYSEGGGNGDAGSALSIQFTVEQMVENLPPTAVVSATPISGTVPLEVSFTGSNSIDDVAVTSYLWDFGDGNSTTNADPIYTYTAAGVYTATLTVTDDEGLQDSDTITITVNEVNVDGVIGFTLVNAANDTDLFDLSNGMEITVTDIQGMDLNIRANTEPNMVGSVFLQLSGPVNNTRTENVAPYALFGDSSGNYFGNELPIGEYVMTATAYTAGNLGGDELATLIIQFSIVDETPVNQPPVGVFTASTLSGSAPLVVSFTASGSIDDNGIIQYAWDFGDGNTSSDSDPVHTFVNPGVYTVLAEVFDAEGLSDSDTFTITVAEPQDTVVSYTLVDADSDTDLFELNDGMQIKMSDIAGVNLNIRANTNPSVVGSVVLEITGPLNNVRIESVAPYALFGDNNGDYFNSSFSLGNYELNATPYDESGGTGNEGISLAISFSIVDVNNASKTQALEFDSAAQRTEMEMSLYPNPSITNVSIGITTSNVILEEIAVFDITGRMIKTYDATPLLTQRGVYTFNVENLGEGVYFVRAKIDNGEVLTRRLVVKK